MMPIRSRPLLAHKAHRESTDIHRDTVSSAGSAVQIGVLIEYLGNKVGPCGMKLSFWGPMLIYDPDIAAKTIAIVKKHLNGGKLTPARIDKSNVRIVQCKERLGKFQ
jgi:hypothetical protein